MRYYAFPWPGLYISQVSCEGCYQIELAGSEDEYFTGSLDASHQQKLPCDSAWNAQKGEKNYGAYC